MGLLLLAVHLASIFGHAVLHGGAPTVDLGGQKLTAVPSVGDVAPVGYTLTGIKYATARRFEDSVLNNNHAYLANASRNLKGDMCMQIQNSPPWTLTSNTVFSEDCLFLDVYLPPNALQSFRLPVVIWSWGGQLLSVGRGTPGAGADLAKHLEAIVVIPQYRTGPFGFLSTGDASSPGNYALSDMKNAFRWVYDNIAKFNGDPKRITISGQSDSAALVSALHLDLELTRKVFATVTQSGSILSPWAIIENPLDNAKLLGKEAGCADSTTAALVACLKALDAATLEGYAEAVLAKVANKAPGAPTWSMVIDRKHIPGDPATLLRDRLARRKTTGSFFHQFLKNDAAIVDYLAFGKDDPANGLVNYIIGTGKPQLPVLKGALIGKVVQQATGCVALPPATIELIANTYGMVAGATDLQLRNALFQLTTDVNHGLPTIKEATIYAETDATKWGNVVMMVSYDGNISAASPLTGFTPGFGAYHTCDLGYLLSGTMRILTAGKDDATVTESFREQYRQIAYTGTTTLEDKFSPAAQNYIELGQDKHWKKANFQRAVQLVKFWDRLKELKCAPPSNIPFVPAAL